jgi:hypothetical protein
MGQAKSRKAEIEALKHLGPRIDPLSGDPEPTAEMARRLHTMFEVAKQNGNIDPPVNFLYSKLETTIQGFGPIPIACKKGCSHCCHVWVSATAPELLLIAKIVRRRGGEVIDRLRAAHLYTKDFSFEERFRQPNPCPMLEQDVCSIYDSRPKACRLAVSGDASLCGRVYRQLTNEKIPTPTLHLGARPIYATAMAVALKRSQLPYNAYEFVAGLIRALDVPDAERAWLSGDNIFSHVMRDPGDVFAERTTQQVFKHAFG